MSDIADAEEAAPVVRLYVPEGINRNPLSLMRILNKGNDELNKVMGMLKKRAFKAFIKYWSFSTYVVILIITKIKNKKWMHIYAKKSLHIFV